MRRKEKISLDAIITQIYPPLADLSRALTGGGASPADYKIIFYWLSGERDGQRFV